MSMITSRFRIINKHSSNKHDIALVPTRSSVVPYCIPFPQFKSTNPIENTERFNPNMKLVTVL